MQKITGVFLITFFFIFNVYAGIVAKTLAIVNNEIITTKDLQDYCMVVQSRVDGKTEDFCDTQDGLDEVLNMLIEDKLIITYAKKKDVEVSDSWVKGRLDEIAASYGSQTEFESVLIAKGLTMATLRAKIADQYLSKFVVEREIKATITISPAEVRDYYIQNIDKFTMPEVYKFVMASSNDKVELDMMAGVIADSGIKIAMSEYKDALTEIELPIEDMRKDMADVIRTIEQNAYKLALIEDKYYLIYLESIVPPQKRELRDVQPVVYGMLWETEFKKRFGEWIEKLKEESVIKILSE